MNDVAVRDAAFSLAAGQVPAAGVTGSSHGPDPETIRTAKGRFPADLNRLRGQLSLEASVGEPVVCALECGSSALLIAAYDDKEFYGIWTTQDATWLPVKADQLYGSEFASLVQNQIKDNSNVWIASFLAFPMPATAPAPAASAAVTAAQTPAPKKKVVRKRPLATPIVTTPSAEEETTITKKAATGEAEEELDL